MDVRTATALTTRVQVLNEDAIAISAAQWLREIPTLYLVFLIISTVATAVVIALAFIHLYVIHYYVRDEHIQTNLYFLALLFPIVGLTSLLRMYLLRSATFLYVISHTYVMVCLVMLVSLLRNLFGGSEMMSKYLFSTNEVIKFNTPPFCCCCKCIPTLQPTERALRHVAWLTLQSPIVRIVAEIINGISFFEQSAYEEVAILVNVIEVISMISALYGCNITMNLGREKQVPYRMAVVFQCVNLTQVFLTLQKFIFDMCGKYDAFIDSPLMASGTKAMYWNSMVLTTEMCALSIAATILLSPSKSKFFDKSHRRVEELRSLPNKRSEDAV
uniref:Organic solute transporter alpha-like protein n=1 Tax=Parascaris univalens TaxID=6257 RepID=A0A915AUI8_PARUN